MKEYKDLTAPAADLSAFIRENWSKLPAPVQEEVAKWDGPGHNAQDRVAAIVETMWAHRTKAGLKTDAAREVVAGIAFYYGGLGLLYFRDGRGERMANALRRDMGEPGFNQPLDEDPGVSPLLSVNQGPTA